MRVHGGVLGLLILVVVLTLAPRAMAQDDRANARAHFARGIELYDEGRLAQAAAEFREAYRLAPSAAVLFNVAQVEAELGHAVEAFDAYERIVADPATTPSMRESSEQALHEQERRIATLHLTVNVAGARISVDDVEVAVAVSARSSSTPSEVGVASIDALRVSEGEHVVTARADGYAPVSYRFVVAGGTTHDAALTLTLSGTSVGSLRVVSRIPGVPVVIDGTPYGLTPLDSSIALVAGTHHVEARRTGYTLFAQDVAIAPGGESTVTIVVEEDPAAPRASHGTLRLSLPSASTQLRIDGMPADESEAASLSLPRGLHDVEVRVAEREPHSQRVDILPETVLDLRPAYEWTPEARETRVSAASSQRDLGLGLLIGGAGALVGGVVALAVVRVDYEQHLGPISSAFAEGGPCHGGDIDYTTVEDTCPAALAGHAVIPTDDPTGFLGELVARAQTDQREYYAMLGVSGAIAGVGAVLVVVGGVLFGTAPSTRQIDASARADGRGSARPSQADDRGPDLRVSLGAGSLTLRGSF